MKPEKKNKKQEIINKYNQTSEFYDRRYVKIQQDKFSLILKDNSIYEKLILDAGCGTGLLFGVIDNSFEIILEKFTLLFSFTSLQNLPDVIEGVKESFRVVKDGTDVNFSILRKKLNKERLKVLLKPLIKYMKIIDIESIEDVLFTGKALKE
ncbi:hypothetical protein ES703_77526 [subsurface metagenome]